MSDTQSPVEKLNQRSEGRLPGMLGIEITASEGGVLRSRMPLGEELMAPNGYLHAATVIALADTSCGYGCFENLPDGAESFTTVELKSNFTGTARSGAIACEARLVHGGRTTQVWDATVTDEESGREICLFRCTQMLLYG
ncbi:PaaI family thioesterase [Rubrobacter aplysinae]|uniref:PaaI family thioesterase n=1 Tax=Rubrobacter aplysinae TaxID=909625 RepID=UPI00064C2BD9|nr:PaaI family thioesterase [Rubrobacter aplysinae]